MKNNNINKVIVACVATIGLFGYQNLTVAAKDQLQTSDENRLAIIGEQPNAEAIEIDLTDINQLNNIEEIIQIPYFPIELMTKSLKPIIKIPAETTNTERTQTVTENKETPSEPTISITTAEKDIFARLVEAEAKGEPYEGKVAVAEVVLNRVESPEFPDTVTGVVTEVVGDSYAFSPVQNGEINKPASEEAKQAVDEAITNDNRLNEATFFYNPEIATDDWIRSREVVTTIGDHVFAK